MSVCIAAKYDADASMPAAIAGLMGGIGRSAISASGTEATEAEGRSIFYLRRSHSTIFLIFMAWMALCVWRDISTCRRRTAATPSTPGASDESSGGGEEEGGGGATAAVAEGEGATEGMGLIRRVGYFLCL